MKRIVPLLALLVLLSGLINEAQAKPTAGDYLKRGDLQSSKNQLVKAIRNYTKAIEIDPSLAKAYVRRGLALRIKGSLNLAIQDFERAAEIDPQVMSNNSLIAESYSDRGYTELNELELASAIEDLTKAIKSQEDALHYYRRGQARLLDQDIEGAIVDFTKALTFDLADDLLRSLVYANRGYARLLQGKEGEALSDLRKGIRRNSGQHVLVELDLRIMEMQMKEIRRQRSQVRRNLS